MKFLSNKKAKKSEAKELGGASNFGARDRSSSPVLTPIHKPKPEPKSLTDGIILLSGGSTVDLEASERFRMLRAQLDRLSLVSEKTDCIAISSAVPSEGKSLVSTNLARAFASDPSGRTIIVDCDLRKPNAHRFFGESSGPGLSDLLVGGKSIEDVLREVEPGLDLIPAGSPVVDSTRTIESPGLKLLLADLKKKYKHVILDCPPVLMCSEVMHVSQIATSTLLVARAWKTEKTLVLEASKLLKEHSLLGIVLNECADSLRQYGYYGYYGYLGSKGSEGSSKNKGFLGRLFGG